MKDLQRLTTSTERGMTHGYGSCFQQRKDGIYWRCITVPIKQPKSQLIIGHDNARLLISEVLSHKP